MNPIQQAISAGRTAIESGDPRAACERLSGVEHPEAAFLLAVAQTQAGNPGEAVVAYGRALVLEPRFDQARSALARLLIDMERYDEALREYETLLDSDPSSLNARFGYATALLGIGRCEDAEAIFEDLINEGHDRPEIRFMRARALLELGEIETAIEELQTSFARKPNEMRLRALAGAQWMIGDKAAFDETVRGALRFPVLLGTAADIVRMSGEPDEAARLLTEARTRQALPYDALSSLAHAWFDAGDADKTESVCREALALNPADDAVLALFVSALLMQGRAREALDAVRPLRESQPDRQHWIAYEATAYRLLGDPRYDALVDLDRFVRAYQIPVPPGYDTIDDFNAALLDALDRWQPYRQHPLNQSVRLGTQTTRDLVGIDDPIVQAYVEALDEPIRRYMDAVGSGPDHPLTARNTGNYRITGCWSVKLGSGGWHVNHVHPEGWISAAYYVFVPTDLGDEDSKAGWIKFGEPAFECTPPLGPQKWVRPSGGMLVLFPSFLWHGTEPIVDGSVRVTAPFDAVPA